MLVGGADTGSSWTIMSIVVGDEGDIARIHGLSGYSEIHMRNITSREEKLRIVTVTKMSGCVSSICLQLDRYKILVNIRAKSKNVSSQKISQALNYAIRDKINEYFGDFCASNGENLSNITFQTDPDLSKVFVSTGMHVAVKGKAHELADVVAWGNKEHIKMQNIVEDDITIEVERKTLKRLNMR
jgi:hypothetical protein